MNQPIIADGIANSTNGTQTTGIAVGSRNGTTTLAAADITLNGAPVVAGDGSSVTVNISIEIGAARGFRKVVVSQPAGAVPPASPGADLFFAEGDELAKRPVLCRWDPHNIPILSERGGSVRFEEIVAGKTMKEEVDPVSGVRRVVIIELSERRGRVRIERPLRCAGRQRGDEHQ